MSMNYLSCSGAVREYVALATVAVDAGASASVLLINPVIRMGAAAGKVVVEIRFGEVVLHHWEWELAAGAVFHLPGKWVLNAGYEVYFASYAAGASLEAFAVISDAEPGDVANGVNGGRLPALIPPGAWYIEETQTWILGCRATYSLDENGMPDVISYSGKVAIPYGVTRAARQNTTGATISSAVDLSPIAFGGSPGVTAGQGRVVFVSDGPFSSEASADVAILADYNEVPANYQNGVAYGDSSFNSYWDNAGTIEKAPGTKLITGQYGPGAATTPGTAHPVSEAWPIRDISAAVAAVADASITYWDFAYCVYEEVYP